MSVKMNRDVQEKIDNLPKAYYPCHECGVMAPPERLYWVNSPPPSAEMKFGGKGWHCGTCVEVHGLEPQESIHGLIETLKLAVWLPFAQGGGS